MGERRGGEGPEDGRWRQKLAWAAGEKQGVFQQLLGLQGQRGSCLGVGVLRLSIWCHCFLLLEANVGCGGSQPVGQDPVGGSQGPSTEVTQDHWKKEIVMS